jgi:Pvc16 N-terminal domain
MTFDLSAITDSLIGLVESQWATAPIWSEVGGKGPPGASFTPSFTGLAPDAARAQPGPQLSLYLYHVESNNATEAIFWKPQMLADSSGQPVRFLPLALDVFYLLFAYSESSYIEEQEAMSVAMRIFHDQPVVRSESGAVTPWELTLTLEHRSYDELSRLWQATTSPLRMSLVYRASVAFLEADKMPEEPKETTSLGVEVDQLDAAPAGAGGGS